MAIDGAADPWHQVSLVIRRFLRFAAIFVYRLQRRRAPCCAMPWPGTGWLHAAVSHIRTCKSQVLDLSRSITHAADPDITRDFRNRHLGYRLTQIDRGNLAFRYHRYVVRLDIQMQSP